MTAVLRAGFHGTEGQPSAQVIDGSLKFDDSFKTNLSRTPASAGNRRITTWSGWTKRSQLGDTQRLMFVGPGSNYFSISFNNDQIQVEEAGGSNSFYVYTNALLRDTGWYHVAVAVDTTQSTQSNRVKVYVNGVDQALTAGNNWPPLNADLQINNTVDHRIGRNDADCFNGLLTNTYLIDGQALTAESFGFTDGLTNTWRPKKYTGDFNIAAESYSTAIGVFTINNTTPNADSTVAYLNSNPNSSSYPLIQSNQSSNNTITVKFASAQNGVTSIKFRGGGYAAGSTYTLFVNGTQVGGTHSTNTLWAEDSHTISSTNITELKIVGSDGFSLGQLKFDDSLVSGTPSYGTEATGVNSFYLPMDGNLLIGQDKSGNGNNWTPQGFGGSVALDKATGALPILNTVNGGNYATAGTRTDANAANLFLAVPLIGSTNDVSNQINSGSTTKVATNSGVDASNAQSNFYGGSHYWGANSDSLTYAEQGSELVFGTGDYTIEFWFFDDSGHTGTGGRNYLFDNRIGGSVVGDPPQIVGFIDGSTVINFSSGDGSIAHTVPSTDNRWIHYAAVRSSGTTTLYLDGISVGTVSGSTNFTNNGIGIGRATDANYGMAGYIQDFRIYKGAAKYTSNFIPASTSPDVLPDTPSGVSGGSKLTKITDGAVYFDASDDYLTTSDSADYTFGSGDWTMELFVNSSEFDNYKALLMKHTATRSTSSFWWAVRDSGAVMFYFYYGSSEVGMTTTGTIALNTWNHVVATRDGNTIRVYINGVQQGTSDVTGLSMNDTSCDLRLGIDDNGAYDFKGFFSNVRVIKGTCLYPSGTSFTPSTSPLTNVTNTKLLCCQSPYEPGSATVAPTVSGINNGTQWSFYTTTTEGPLGPKDFYATGNDADHLFDGNNAVDCYGGYGLGGATDSNIIFAPPNGITVSSKLEVYVGYYSKIKVNGTDHNTGGESTAQAWVTVSNGGVNFTGSLNQLILENTANGNVVRAGAIRIDDSTLLLDPLSPNGNAAATTFNPFTTDIDAVRGQEIGYPTWNPLVKSTSTLSNSNLTLTTAASGYLLDTVNMFTPAGTGRWYWEFVTTARAGTDYTMVGMLPSDNDYVQGNGNIPHEKKGISVYIGYNGDVNAANGAATAGTATATFTIGDILGWAFDAENGTLKCFKNGAPQGTQFTNVRTDVGWAFCLTDYDHTNASTHEINYGQNPFNFPPPAGYQPLNAANIRPETVISRPDQYVGATIYTGNQTARSILTGHAPDLVWIKDRTQVHNHQLLDSVRGAPKILQTDETVAEITDSTDSLTSFNYNGFTLGANALGSQNYEFNKTGNNYVAWTWRAGGHKGTFNVDDVGYANASDVNMSVGSLNSFVYNQTQTWSNNITTTANSGSMTATSMFDTNFTNYTHCNADGLAVTVTFTINPPVPIKESITLFGGLTSYNAGTISINDGPTFGLTLCAAVDPSFTDSTVIPFTGLVNKITVKRTSTASAGLLLFGWKFDDQRLIDSGLSAPDAPSIAPTGCSVNTKSKFGIYTWNGHGASNETLPHRLGAKPDFMICKKKSTGGNSWVVWHKSIADTRYMLLNSQAAAELDATLFNSHLDDGDNLWSLGTNNSISDTGQSAVAYLWCDVPGLQKFGSFEANQDADGPFIELGFRPAVVWIKNIDNYDPPYDWVIYDNARSTSNANDKFLSTNLANSENSGSGGTETTRYVDFLSNGFKVRTASTAINLNAHTQVYCAWAEAPSIDLYGGGANAR